MKLSKLIMKVKFKALHVNPVIFNSIKQSDKWTPMTDAITGDVDENMVMFGDMLILRDDSVDDFWVDVETSGIEVSDEMEH